MLMGNIPNEGICRSISNLLKSGKLNRSDAWLDVGCGAGAHTSLATNWFPNFGLNNYTGIDIDGAAVEYCKLRFALWPDFTFEKISFEAYDKRKFKLIVDCFCVAYCKEREKAVAHIGRLLANAGHYIGVWPGNNQYDAPMLSGGYVTELFRDLGQVEYTHMMEGSKGLWLVHVAS